MIKISPHCHAESHLTGSTLANLVKRAKDLGRTHFAYTDHGRLSSCLKAYKQSKDAGLKFAAGIEFYFKDSACPIVAGTPADRCKYFTGTLFTTDQTAYQELCRTISKTDLPKTEISEEEQQLWNWERLEHLAKFNTLLVLGGPHCMVGKALLADGPELAEKVFAKLHAIYGNRLYTSLLCSKYGKRYANVIHIKYKDGSHNALLSTDHVKTDKAKNIKALDLFKRAGHSRIESYTANMTHYPVGKDIKEVLSHKGFLPLPGGDVTEAINKFLYAMSKKYGVKSIVTDYSYYATKEDKIVQTMVLGGSYKLYSDFHMRTQEEFEDYLMGTMALDLGDTAKIIENTNAFASEFDNFALKYEWRLAETGENPLQRCMDIIKQNGRMKWDNPVYVARLREEIAVIAKNPVKDFSGYFLPIYDVINHYKENGKLTGPGRGSAGGSLFVYLMGITQFDPIKYGLSFPRFLSLDRLKNGDIPDVDSDFPDRDLLVGKDGKSGYLYGRWGNKAAQISTRHTVRLKSAITDTNRYLFETVQPEITAFSKSLPEPPQGVTDAKLVFGYKDTDGNSHPGLLETYEPLKHYVQNRPKEWDIVQKAIGITRAHSQHASAFVLSDTPISDILPVKDGHITQYEAKQCEAAGLIKYDFLVVSNILDIETCLNLINKKNGELLLGNPSDIVGWYHPESDSSGCADCEDPVKFLKENSDGLVELLHRSCEAAAKVRCSKCDKSLHLAKQKGNQIGYFTHKEKLEYIWDLPIDPEVFKSIWSGDTETLFQLNTKTMTPAVKQILPASVEDVSTILALKRPGPMDYTLESTGRTMDEEYVWRRRGDSEPDIKELFDLIPETYGVIVFQEQSLKISKELGGMSPSDAEKLRRIFSKKLKEEALNMKPTFMSTALSKVGQEKAEKIWGMMETSSRYSFNASHSVAYALISYAGMFLKHHYPLEWWAAILTNATQKEISGKLWTYVKDFVASPDINLSTDEMVIDYANEKIRAKLGVIKGMGDPTIQPIVDGRPYKNIQDFVDKDVAGNSLTCKLIHIGVLDSLFPPKTTLMQKLQAYEDAVEVRNYNKKVAEAAKEGKLIRATQPKRGTVDEKYLEFEKDPWKGAAAKKSVLPTLVVGMHHLAMNHSRVLKEGLKRPSRIVVSPFRRIDTMLLSGEELSRLDSLPAEMISEDKYVAATGYVVEMKTFQFANKTKTAMKLIMDFDGYTSERVLWPDYESQQLIYPEGLKKGAIVTLFLKKRQFKPDAASIMHIIIEG